MGLFEQFPYTNFHELNLDWLIEQLKRIMGTTVLSVNGETGDVVLYKDPLVRLPDITQDTWNLFRYADGAPVGIQFKKGSPLQRIDNLGRYDIYDANNPPPYPVTAVNGQTGDVVISIPVQSVNGMTGNIILYQQANVELPALESEDTWSIWRETETNAVVGVRFTSGQPMKRMDDGDEYTVFDTGNPPPYPVTSVAGLTGAVAFLNTQIVTEQGTQKVKILFPVESVDGLTGTVKTWANTTSETLKTPAASEGDRWSLARECPSGDIGIRFTYDSNNGVRGYLVFSDGQNPESTLRILTPNDIPSSSGVVSVNGLAGVVTLYASDLQMSSGDATTIPQAINNKAPIESLAIPIIGNVSSVNVPAKSFVYVKNSTISGITDGLYIAVNAISANTAFTSADLTNTDTTEGGLNALNSKLTNNLSMVDFGIISDMPSLISAISTFESDLENNTTRFVKFNVNTITDYWNQWEYHTGIIQKDDANNWTAVFIGTSGNTLDIGSRGNYFSSKEEKNRVSTLETSVINFYGFTLGQAQAITAKPYERLGIAFGIWSTNIDSKKIIPFGITIPANATTLTINNVTLYDDGEVTSGSYDVQIMTWRAS